MILATAGHIDHGKTALVRALTGVDADRLPEEKRRGLTIDLGFAYTTLPDGTELGFVDVPGHERFLPNMLAGILSIDRVMLIVAADDGPRPQTLEHLDIIELIGITEISGIITKIDRVGAERRAAVASEVRALLAAAGYRDSPVFAVSSRTGEGIAALAEHLRDSAATAGGRAARPATGPFRLAIDRAFTLAGIGLVVTGTVAAGTVAAGDRLIVSPRGTEVRIRGIHAHNRPIEHAQAGERCALNLAGSFAQGAEPRRGDWVVAPPAHAPTSRIDVGLTVARSAPATLRDGVPVHVHLGTADAVGRAAILGGHTLSPGASGFIQLDLDRPIGALWGDRMVLRDHAARHTLAGGRVVDPFAPRRGRGRPERLLRLAALAEVDAGSALARLVDLAGTVELTPFQVSRNLAPQDLDALVAAGGLLRLGPGRRAVAASAEHLQRLEAAIAAALGEWHRAQPDTLGPSRAALFRTLRGAAPESALMAALAALIAAGGVAQRGALVHLTGHEPRLTRDDERLWQRLEPLLAAGGLRPPRLRELAPALGVELEPLARFLRRAERVGRIAPVAANRVFLPDTLARLAEIARELAEHSADGSFAAADFKERSGIGRNLTIEVLEYLDSIGITRRIGDTRIVLRAGD